MRFTAIATVFSLAALASAQTSTAPSTESGSASSTTTSLSPQATCLAACGAADICCQAKCVGVPCPDETAVNDTTACAASCDQGSGSQADTERYAQCQSSCISSLFFTATASGNGNNPAQTNSPGQTTRTNTPGSTTTSTGPSDTTSPNAAPGVHFGLTGAGLIGLFIAGLAL